MSPRVQALLEHYFAINDKWPVGSRQVQKIVKEIANYLVASSKTKNISIEWHIIPILSQLDREQLNQIFEPNITCHGIIHAIVQASGEVKLIETGGLYARSDEFH